MQFYGGCWPSLAFWASNRRQCGYFWSSFGVIWRVPRRHLSELCGFDVLAAWWPYPPGSCPVDSLSASPSASGRTWCSIGWNCLLSYPYGRPAAFSSSFWRARLAMLRPCSWAPFWVEWYSWISSSWLYWQLRAGLADCDGARRAAGDFDSWSIRSGLDCASQGMVAQYSRPSPDSICRETSSVTAVIVHYVGSRWSKSLALWNLSATVSCFARPSLLGHGINRHWCSRTILPGPWGLCSWHE